MIKLNLFLYSNMIKNLYIYCDNYVYRFTKEYIISINQKLKAKIIHNLNENINSNKTKTEKTYDTIIKSTELGWNNSKGESK
mgnify:CR=1 FL=1